MNPLAPPPWPLQLDSCQSPSAISESAKAAGACHGSVFFMLLALPYHALMPRTQPARHLFLWPCGKKGTVPHVGRGLCFLEKRGGLMALVAVQSWLVLVLLAGLAAGLCSPLPDLPYEEIVASRFAATGPAAPQWPKLPVSLPVQMLPTTLSGTTGVLLLGTDGDLHFAHDQGGGIYGFALVVVPLPTPANACRLGDFNGSWAAAVCPGMAALVSCRNGLSCSLTTTVTDQPWRTVHAVLATTDALYVSSDEGLYHISGKDVTQLVPEATFVLQALDGARVVAATLARVYFFDGQQLQRYDWVTNSTSGAGGVYDERVRAMVYQANAQTLYLGTDSALNIQTADGVVLRYSGLEGLPYNQSTAMALTADGQQLWLGTKRGAARWDIKANNWRYFYGPRYLPGTSIVTAIAVLNSDCVVVATDGGVAFLTSQSWTLAKKAAHYEEILQRHNRHGMVSE